MNIGNLILLVTGFIGMLACFGVLIALIIIPLKRLIGGGK